MSKTISEEQRKKISESMKGGYNESNNKRRIYKKSSRIL